jgi:hypothetical protein
MARAATKKTSKPSKVAKPRKAAARIAAKPVKTTSKAAAKKTAPAKAAPISKDALRSQVEQLAAANATLKTKNREANKALKAALAQIADLEHQISQSDAKPIIEHAPAPKAKTPRKPRTPKIAAEPPPAEEAETPDVPEPV